MFVGGGGSKVDAIFPCLLDKVSVQLELGSFTLFVVAAAFAVVATVAGVVHELGLSTLPAAIHNLGEEKFNLQRLVDTDPVVLTILKRLYPDSEA